MKNLLIELLKFQSLSGYEKIFANYLADKLTSFGNCNQVRVDEFNNVIAFYKSPNVNLGKKLMIEAHLDQVGLMVADVKDGFVSFVNVGGIDKRILLGAEVTIVGKSNVVGVIGSMPPHLKDSTDAALASDAELLIDVGYSKAQLDCLIKPGDPIFFELKIVELLNEKISAPSLDNKASIAAVLNLARSINAVCCDLYIVFSPKEELGTHCVCSAVMDINPNVAISVDVTHGDSPDSGDNEGVFKLGAGAIICRGPNLDYDVALEIINIAQQNNILYDVEVAPKDTGTTAQSIQVCRQGIKTALISIPLRYMHTSVETLYIGDIKQTSNLLSKIVERGDLC